MCASPPPDPVASATADPCTPKSFTPLLSRSPPVPIFTDVVPMRVVAVIPPVRVVVPVMVVSPLMYTVSKKVEALSTFSVPCMFALPVMVVSPETFKFPVILVLLIVLSSIMTSNFLVV